MREIYDVVVVGGGAAGLSAALTLGRARRSVLVLDDGTPRNAPASAVHNVLTRDGTPPLDLLAAGRADVGKYGGEIVADRATAVAALDGEGFQVTLAGGRAVVGRRLLVATGLTDTLPALPGLAERFGRDVLHCPYCHGWEVRDRPIGVLATATLGPVQAALWRQWSADVTLLTHVTAGPSAEQREGLEARGVRIVDGEVVALEVAGDELIGVRLATGVLVAMRVLVIQSRFAARADLLAGLGLAPVPFEMHGHPIGTRIESDPDTGATAVPGLYLAGNVTDLSAQVVHAAAAGVSTGAAINADLVAADTREAIARRTSGIG
jgi:thioredoxin reductase